MDFNQNASDASQYADRVNIVYYTDPLCCWSWALECHWQRLLAEHPDRITYSYCMAGMIPDWQKFSDPVNSVNRPVQMGPVWMDVKYLTQTQIDDSIWVKDPPLSSYPACIAVKACGLQSALTEELFLRRIRRAVMTEGRNISRTDVLLDLAKEVSQQFPNVLDVDQFGSDINSEVSRQAFRNDLAKVRYHQIGRYPSITMSIKGGKSLILTGYRPYEILEQAFQAILGETAICKATNVKDT